MNHFRLANAFCRRNSDHGGSRIFVKMGVITKELNSLNEPGEEESFELSVTELVQYEVIVICIYRSPDGKFNIFLNKLELKGKGKGRFLELFQHWDHLAYCILTPNKFPHSPPEAPRIIQMRETSTSEGRNYYQIFLANSNLRKSARIFYMPQSWDMGQILFTSPLKEGILRIFRTPEKSNGFGRVWTRELGFQWKLELLIQKLMVKHNTLILCGDWNINFLQNSPQKRELNSLLLRYSYWRLYWYNSSLLMMSTGCSKHVESYK